MQIIVVLMVLAGVALGQNVDLATRPATQPATQLAASRLRAIELVAGMKRLEAERLIAAATGVKSIYDLHAMNTSKEVAYRDGAEALIVKYKPGIPAPTFILPDGGHRTLPAVDGEVISWEFVPVEQPGTQPATRGATTQAAGVAVFARYTGRIETMALDNASKQEMVLDAPVIVRNARDYDAFIARIPEREISKTNPSPPSADPLLKKPEIDFQKQMLIAVICAQSMYLPPEITSVRAAGDALEVTVVERDLEEVLKLNNMQGIGTYSAVVVARCAGEVKIVTQPARRPD
jgi:hypothetical protein